MENEIENEGGGITVGYIFRTIFSQKWLALLIAAAITIVGTVGLYFMGKYDEIYSVSFVLQLPNTGDATTTSYTYPDGESFYFTDLISADNLKQVASREGFEKIDVDKMVKKNDISITRAVDKLDDNSTEGVYDLNYTVKVKAKYFSDEDSARDFIEALTVIPREHIAQMNINYDQSLTTSKSAVTYDEQLTLLKNQALYVQSKYDTLIKSYGNDFKVNDGRSLAQCKGEIDSYIAKDLFASLISIAKENGYIKANAEAELKYQGDLDTVNRQLNEAQKTLDGLKDISSSSFVYDRIIELNREIAGLTIQRDILEKYLASYRNATPTPAKYEEEISKVEATVSEFTEGIKPVSSDIYGKVTKINYLSTRIVETEGGRGLVMSVAISLVAGIVVAMIVAYIVGWNKQRKAAAPKNVAGVPVYGEGQLQAAVTDESEEDAKNDKK